MSDPGLGRWVNEADWIDYLRLGQLSNIHYIGTRTYAERAFDASKEVVFIDGASQPKKSVLDRIKGVLKRTK